MFAGCGSNDHGDGETTLLGSNDARFCASAFDAAVAQYAGFRDTYLDPTRIPRSYENARVNFVAANDWTSGFVAGSFWLVYRGTLDPSWRATAEDWTNALIARKDDTTTHDIGFVIESSFGRGQGLTGSMQYAEVVLDAARSLGGRYSDSVGAIRSWDWGSWQYPVIVDNMMNLELLLHAAELASEPNFARIALQHAVTTRDNHYRGDASSYHVVDFDPGTGAVLWRGTHQGLADESVWARGQAWGLYGFTMVSRFAKSASDARFAAFRDHAEAIARFYTQHPDMPPDNVPYFDFWAPDDPTLPDPRDASAAAIAASALLELARLVPPARGRPLTAFALATLRSLASPEYVAEPAQSGHFILTHSVGNYPAQSEVDVAINYADYYYLEALLRCLDLAKQR
jgi:hypothetical protein